MFLLPTSSRARIVFCVLAFLIFLLVPGAPDSESLNAVTGPALVCFLGSVVYNLRRHVRSPSRLALAGRSR